MLDQAINVLSVLFIYTVLSIGFTFVIAAAFFGFPEDDPSSPEHKDH